MLFRVKKETWKKLLQLYSVCIAYHSTGHTTGNFQDGLGRKIYQKQWIFLAPFFIGQKKKTGSSNGFFLKHKSLESVPRYNKKKTVDISRPIRKTLIYFKIIFFQLATKNSVNWLLPFLGSKEVFTWLNT